MTITTLVIVAILCVIYNPARVIAAICLMLLIYVNPTQSLVALLIVLPFLYYHFKK